MSVDSDPVHAPSTVDLLSADDVAARREELTGLLSEPADLSDPTLQKLESLIDQHACLEIATGGEMIFAPLHGEVNPQAQPVVTFDFDGLPVSAEIDFGSGLSLTVQRDEWEAIGTEAIARICHEVNRIWCQFNGDMSQDIWAEAADWQRESAIQGVEFLRDNPDAGDSALHDNWCADKRAAGWVYGPEKDAEAKTHPCLVPFEELPAEQQFKDRLFRTVVKAALAVSAT